MKIVESLRRLSMAEATHSSTATSLTLIAAVAMALLHMAQVQFYFLPSGQFKNLHLGFAILVVLLTLIERTAPERVWSRRWLSLLALLAIVPTVYIHLEYQALVEIRSFKPNTADTFVAMGLVLLSLYTAGRQWGWTIPVLAFASMIYALYGMHLPGELFAHAGIKFGRMIGYTSIPYFQGLLGGLTELSAGTIFMFMLFAGVLQVTGGIDFIIKMAYAIGGRTRAGPAQVAVVSSGFMGMISGSTVANVATTGTLTIPMMKRYGFKPEFAGAVEAVASTGGQVTPPVMGLAAFLIVAITGIPYVEIIAAAAAPAFIYYAYLMFAVHIRALKVGLDARDAKYAGFELTGSGELERMTLTRACLEYGHLLFAIIVLVVFLVRTMPPGTAALYSLLTLLVLDVLKRLVKQRATPLAALADVGRMLVQGLEAGARTGAQVAIVVAVMAILIEFMSVTGFAQKLSVLMLDLAGGNLMLLMFMAAATCLAFGLGLPTTAAYILVALLGAPALVELGVPLLAAHMFVFYFANVSAITPPVAVASLIASNIANANFVGTAMLSVRLGLPGFLLPFLFMVHPEILGLDTTFAMHMLVTALALVAVMALNVVAEGYFLTRLVWWERLMLAPAAFGLLWPGFAPTAVGVALLAVVVVRQVVVSRAIARAAS